MNPTDQQEQIPAPLPPQDEAMGEVSITEKPADPTIGEAASAAEAVIGEPMGEVKETPQQVTIDAAPPVPAVQEAPVQPEQTPVLEQLAPVSDQPETVGLPQPEALPSLPEVTPEQPPVLTQPEAAPTEAAPASVAAEQQPEQPAVPTPEQPVA